MTLDPETEKRFLRVKDRLMKAVREELSRGEIRADQLLALMAHSTGAVLALQDQRTMTPSQGMKLIADNIEAGNREALAEVLSASGRPV